MHRRQLPGHIALRPERVDDEEFLLGLYAGTRAAELSLTGWPFQQQHDFLRWQFELQRTHYRAYYAGARFDIITLDEKPIGRMYVLRQSPEIRLMEMSIDPAFRNLGIGSHLLQGLIEEADHDGLAVTLHVEPANPAVNLYARFGFRIVEQRGANLFMERTGPGISTGDRFFVHSCEIPGA